MEWKKLWQTKDRVTDKEREQFLEAKTKAKTKRNIKQNIFLFLKCHQDVWRKNAINEKIFDFHITCSRVSKGGRVCYG